MSRELLAGIVERSLVVPDAAAEYLHHVETATQIVRVANGLAAIGANEFSKAFTSSGLYDAYQGGASYVVQAAQDGYFLRLVNRGSSPVSAPAIAKIVMPAVCREPVQEKVDQDLYIIAHWDELSSAAPESEQSKPIDEKTHYDIQFWEAGYEPVGRQRTVVMTFPRFKYDMPTVLMRGDASNLKSFLVENENNSTSSFEILIPEANDLPKLATRNEALFIMSEIEALWTLHPNSYAGATLADVIRDFSHVQFEKFQGEWPLSSDIDQRMSFGGQRVNGQLAWWLSKHTYRVTNEPEMGFRVIFQTDSADEDSMTRFVVYK